MKKARRNQGRGVIGNRFRENELLHEWDQPRFLNDPNWEQPARNPNPGQLRHDNRVKVDVDQWGPNRGDEFPVRPPPAQARKGFKRRPLVRDREGRVAFWGPGADENLARIRHGHHGANQDWMVGNREKALAADDLPFGRVFGIALW